MDHPEGASLQRADRVDFDPRVRLEFRGTQLSSDGGLLVMREFDDALGLSDWASAALCDTRSGKNTVHRLDGLFRQSVFGRLAGYEDVNDADRLALDPVIRAVEFTASREGDSPVLPDLLDQIPDDEDIGTVTADGAYDTRRCHSAIIARGGAAIIPIRKNGRPWKEDCAAAQARNETLRATRHYGRAFWKRLAEYHARSRAEAKMRCLKSFGERIAARDPDRQTAEIHIRVALINRFNALGTAEIVRVP